MCARSLFAVLFWWSAIAGPVAEESRWSQFRGPNGKGVAPDGQKLPIEFGAEKNVLWKTALPSGHSSPCIWGDRIFLTGFDKQAQKLETLCLNRSNGQVLWSRAAPAEKIEKVHEVNSPAAATPVADGNRVYAYFASYGLLCYDFDGNEQWTKPIPTPDVMFGSGTSPILVGDLLVLNCDQGSPFGGKNLSIIMAVRTSTGETAWQKERRGFTSSHSTPVHWQHDGVDEILVRGSGALVAYALPDGEERWRVSGLPISAASTPVIADELVFLAGTDLYGDSDLVQLPSFDELARKVDKNGDGKLSRDEIPSDFTVLTRGRSDGAGDFNFKDWFFRGADEDKDGTISREEWEAFIPKMETFSARRQAAAVALRLGGQGDVTKTNLVWKETKAVPEVPSPLYYQDRVYLLKNGGIVTCLVAKTGEVVYRERLGTAGSFYASPVAGDGKIYAASGPGIIIVFEAGDTLKMLAKSDLGEAIFATPAIVDGKLYIRTEAHLYAFGDSSSP